MNAGWFVKLGMKREELPAFWRYLDNQFDSFRTLRSHLMVYPEGRRWCKPYCWRLRRGLIGYAWDRRVKVQVMSVFGMEHGIDEFSLSKDFSEPCLVEYRFGPILYPQDFPTEDDFFQAISFEFTKLFDTTYEMVSPQNRREHYIKTDEDREWMKKKENRIFPS